MIRVTDTTKNAYKNDSTLKDVEVRIPGANITLTNEDVLADSLELKEAIETGDNLSFQGCIASSFKIECFNLVDETLEGEWIECDIVAHTADPDDEETIPLFRGYISEVTNTTHEEFTTEIRAYDALYTICNSDVTSWYNALSFPISVKNMRDSFFSHFGITQVADYLPNDGMAVTKTITDKVIVGGTIIKAICQVNGRYGRIGRTGLFEYVHLVVGTEALYPREDLFPDDDLFPADENALDNVSKAYYKSISFENYRVTPIDKVQLINKEGQIAAVAGSGSNIFTLKDNPLIWDKTSAQLVGVATNLYNAIRGLWYTPSEVECVGLPYVECGDFVLMTARRSIIRAYVLSRTLKGIQDLNDSYTANGDKLQPTYIPDVQTQTNANAAAITSEVSRATIAESGLNTSISNESSRARSAESGLQSGINNEASIRASQINAVNVRCDSLSAKDAQIENLVATKASISDLNATNASIGNLSAQVASVGNLVASKANISDLNATNARIGTIEANYITASRVDSKIASALYNVNTSTLTCNSISLHGSRFDGSVRIVTTYHAYDCIGNQVY